MQSLSNPSSTHNALRGSKGFPPKSKPIPIPHSGFEDTPVRNPTLLSSGPDLRSKAPIKEVQSQLTIVSKFFEQSNPETASSFKTVVSSSSVVRGNYSPSSRARKVSKSESSNNQLDRQVPFSSLLPVLPPKGISSKPVSTSSAEIQHRFTSSTHLESISGLEEREIRPPLSNKVEIKTLKDLELFKINWNKDAWKGLQVPIRMRVYEEFLYNEVHRFFGTLDEDEIQRGGEGRVLKVKGEAVRGTRLVAKRSSPRKQRPNSRRQQAIRRSSEAEFAFFQDVQGRIDDISLTSTGRPNFPRAKLLITLETMEAEPSPDPVKTRYSYNSGSYAIMMEDFGSDLLEIHKKGIEDKNELAIHFLQVLEGLVFINDAGYAHLDCKPENFFKSGLGDFGFVERISTNTSLTTNKGTFNYIPPEIVLFHQSTQKSDTWSLGAALYTLIVGEPILPLDEDFNRKSVGQVHNYLYLLHCRLEKFPQRIVMGYSESAKKNLFTKDTSGNTAWSRPHGYRARGSNSQSPYISPFTLEGERLLFPECLERLGYFKSQGKWCYIKKVNGKSKVFLLRSKTYSEILREWRKTESRKLDSMKTKVSAEFGSDLTQDDRAYLDLVLDFLEKALDPDPINRASPKELLKTEFMDFARSVRNKKNLDAAERPRNVTSSRQLFEIN